MPNHRNNTPHYAVSAKHHITTKIHKFQLGYTAIDTDNTSSETEIPHLSTQNSHINNIAQVTGLIDTRTKEAPSK